jgi:hypothetical protein
MLEKKIGLNISANLSGNPFSFDELFPETRALFEREGVPEFIRVLLAFIDEYVINNWYQQHGKYCYDSPLFRKSGIK